MQAIKFRLRTSGNVRDLAMFSLAIDSKLRASDLTSIRVRDVAEFRSGGAVSIKPRAAIIQRKTRTEVAFEISMETATAVRARIEVAEKFDLDRLFSPRRGGNRALSARQYERLVKDWVHLCGLNPMKYGTHSLRRTKVALLYKQTGNLRAAQLLLGHKSIENTARYLGIEQDDALTMSERLRL